jgi:hypothetical protein
LWIFSAVGRYTVRLVGQFGIDGKPLTLLSQAVEENQVIFVIRITIKGEQNWVVAGKYKSALRFSGARSYILFGHQFTLRPFGKRRS